MGWKAYRLVYQVKSPIHIGWQTLGYIKLTRYYITGRNIWGAMTANIVRACYGHEDYAGVGNILCKHILISYFYPAIDSQCPLLPKFTNEGLKYGNYPVIEFERLFIKSFGQTAVLPESNTAEDESLHESEYLQPVVYTNDKQEKVYFVGYIFISEEAKYKEKQLKYDNIRDALMELSIGGERKYGWGRLSLKEELKDVDKAFENKLILTESDLKIEIAEGKNIPAHLGIKTGINIKMKGDIEPLVGREWGNIENGRIGAGQKISDAKICWMPGSVMEEKIPLKIGEFGILTS